MDRLAELKRKVAELRKATQEILDKAKAEEDRALTDDENTKVKASIEEMGQVQDQAEAEEKRQADLAKIDQRSEGWNTNPESPELDTRGVVQVGADREAAQPFATLGAQLRSIQDSCAQGATVDKRLLHIMAETRAPSGSSEGVPHEGGFLVQKDFSATLLQKTYELGQISSRLDVVPIGPTANGITINTVDETSRTDGNRKGGVRAYWTNEAGVKTGSKPKFGQINMPLEKLTALWYATDELLADTVALGALAQTFFSEEMNFKIEDAAVNGDGAGKPLGVLNAGCLVSVAKETGQVAATIVYENIVKMWARCWAKSRLNAGWFINQDVEPQLFGMGITVGTGGTPAYMPPGGLSAAPYGTLFGRPVIPVEYCPTLGTVGDIMLGDFAQYLAIAKGGMKSDSSIHVRFIYDETTFRFVYRFNGQPWWSAALTPFKGTNTLSPFVVLATRA